MPVKGTLAQENPNDARRSQAVGIGIAQEALEALGSVSSANAHGAPSAKITARTETPGNISRTIMPVPELIAGTRMDWRASRIVTNSFASRWRLWNERDPILKERLFGLTGNEGNHGEDVKEYYFYLDSTPTHSYMKYLYKYPQTEFPYSQLVEENRRRGKDQPEFELLDAGVFKEDRYFDVFVEYAKGDVEDILIKITATNRGPETAPLRLLPTIWFRNTWSWATE